MHEKELCKLHSHAVSALILTYNELLENCRNQMYYSRVKTDL